MKINKKRPMQEKLNHIIRRKKQAEKGIVGIIRI